MGELLTRYFAPDFPIRVHDVRPRPRDVKSLGATPATLAQVCRQDVIIPCVPIAEFEPLMRRIRELIKPDALVIDVCSVKEHPVRVMKALLPRTVEILATHPNFGPDSAAESLQGRQVAVCKVRVRPERFKRIKTAMEDKGLQLVAMTPREHDRRMAASLVLTHFIGRGLIAFGSKPTGIDTEGYKRLLRILQTVQNDTWQLFHDMNEYNAFAPTMRKRFLASLASVDRKVKQ